MNLCPHMVVARLRVDEADAAESRHPVVRDSLDLLDGKAGALPGDEAAGDLGGTVAQRRLRAHRVLAEVDSVLPFGLDQVTRERYWDRAGRCPVAPPFDLRAQVK